MKTKALIAETHPAEYLIHKYWARKPSNILSQYINNYFSPGDLLVDPFCGSGVFLAEAKKQNIRSFGFDINPIASLLTEVTTDPPCPDDFENEFNKIIQILKSKYLKLYEVADDFVRYNVHEVVCECPSCKKLCSIRLSVKAGRKYLCPACNSKLSFNFENMKKTNIVSVICKNKGELLDKEVLDPQNKLASQGLMEKKYDRELITNRRILAFPGMKISDLFTGRAFLILSNAFELTDKIKDIKTQNAIRLLLTSSVAQCSRLIPYRNNLTTGGPAWTIPGFWIAPLHLEANPIFHIEARLKKFLKGIRSLQLEYKNSKVSSIIKNLSAQRGLDSLKDRSVDGFFFDPPYGDNVPYVEFSEVWNCFIGNRSNYDEEIVVSNRKEFESTWSKYEDDIYRTIQLFEKKLKDNGKIIMTFNNLDPRAWKIVLGAFVKCNFICREASYQVPAVISSKAQKAANTSYVGDYYCVFSKSKSRQISKGNIFEITEVIKKVLLSRKGRAPKNLVYRMAILTILTRNLSIDFIDEIDECIKSVAVTKGEYFILRDELTHDLDTSSYVDLESEIQKTAVTLLQNGKMPLKYFYESIADVTQSFGSPSLSELKTLLKGVVLFEGGSCYLQNINIKQTSLF